MHGHKSSLQTSSKNIGDGVLKVYLLSADLPPFSKKKFVFAICLCVYVYVYIYVCVVCVYVYVCVFPNS